ncbi:MAG TPA: DUF1289 domain-containing protein [Steroidobacteraceae bacterium]|jgi:predicted Fe-S protein YdhL (DUF1289 family)|nr:DUF1289 domain-containing protein [Steroidobacteraceae bacterium]
MSQTPDDRSTAPGSPCINVCILGAAGYCLGCLRTGDEIARWREMSAAEQWRLIEQLRQRRAKLAATGVSPPDGGSNES